MKRSAPLLLLAAAAGISLAARATTYTVRPDGTGDFPTIQAAVNAAAAGDVIELADGTFTGVGNRDIGYLGKAIVVRSASGDPDACVIDCEGGPYRGFYFHTSEGSGSGLDAVTVTNGNPNFWGGAVRIIGASPTITRCVFRGNHGLGEGGAVSVEGGDARFTMCRFAENSATDGGAVSICDFPGLPTFTRCTFVRNEATLGGGVRL
jgi:hypothetical protein